MKHLKIISSPSEVLEDYDAVYYESTDECVIYKRAKESPKVETIDLGITNAEGKKVLWCTCNIGATSPEEYGKYFQWGDTVGYEGDEALSHSTWETCPFNNGSSSYDETYFNSVKDTVCPNGILAAEYDAATVAYGEGYRLPTEAEYELLTANTTSEWTTINGVNGYRFTSKVDSSKNIFFPTGGAAYNGSLNNVGNYGNVWASSLDATFPFSAWRLGFSDGDMDTLKGNRYYGCSVRGVWVED